MTTVLVIITVSIGHLLVSGDSSSGSSPSVGSPRSPSINPRRGGDGDTSNAVTERLSECTTTTLEPCV